MTIKIIHTTQVILVIVITIVENIERLFKINNIFNAFDHLGIIYLLNIVFNVTKKKYLLYTIIKYVIKCFKILKI